jgi:hypothetical protein
MVVDFSDDRMMIWVTGTSSPCLSVFRPIQFSDFQENTIISSETEWKSNEEFHRNALFCSENYKHAFHVERDELEAGFVNLIAQNQASPENPSLAAVQNCANQRREFLKKWGETAKVEKKVGGHYLYRTAWKRFNKEANLKINL